MARSLGRRTPGGGPLMTLVAVMIFLLPFLALGSWVTMTPEGKASWQQAVHQVHQDDAVK